MIWLKIIPSALIRLETNSSSHQNFLTNITFEFYLYTSLTNAVLLTEMLLAQLKMLSRARPAVLYNRTTALSQACLKVISPLDDALCFCVYISKHAAGCVCVCQSSDTACITFSVAFICVILLVKVAVFQLFFLSSFR